MQQCLPQTYFFVRSKQIYSLVFILLKNKRFINSAVQCFTFYDGNNENSSHERVFLYYAYIIYSYCFFFALFFLSSSLLSGHVCRINAKN